MLYFLSQYTWLFLLLFIFVIKNQSKYQTVPEFPTSHIPKKWNSSYNPHIFGLISDLHLTKYRPNHLNDANAILRIFNDTGVEKVFTSGDISDNFGTNKTFKFGHQYEDDFLEYVKIVQQYPDDFIITVSGNHDEFGVESYKSREHFILKYCNYYKNKIFEKYENFLISKVNLDDIEIFILNPYHYPTVRAGVGYFMHLTTDMLDHIEKVLFEKSDSNARILITHFPTSFCNHAKSTSRRTLSEILSMSNLTSIIAGHSHAYRILHRNSTLEIHSPSIAPGKTHKRCYGYVSIDNGGFQYHMANLSTGELGAVLTYPIERKFLSKASDFSCESVKKSEVRVVAFSEDRNLNISVTCRSVTNSNNVHNGSLKFQRVVRRNESLYSSSFEDICGHQNTLGNFSLDFSGDWNYSADFYAGDSVKLDKEVLENDVNLYIGTSIIGVIMWLFVLFVWCPFISPPKVCHDLNLWINGATMSSSAKTLGILFGFLPMKTRIYSNLTKGVQLCYFLVALSPLILPIGIMKIGEGQFGAIFFFGYYLNGFVSDIWGWDLFGLFAILVLLPSTIVFSSIAQFKQSRKFKFVFVFDALMVVCQIPLAVFAIGRFLYQSTSLLFAATSPVLGFGFLIIFCLEIVEFFA